MAAGFSLLSLGKELVLGPMMPTEFSLRNCFYSPGTWRMQGRRPHAHLEWCELLEKRPHPKMCWINSRDRVKCCTCVLLKVVFHFFLYGDRHFYMLYILLYIWIYIIYIIYINTFTHQTLIYLLIIFHKKPSNFCSVWACLDCQATL